jgi:CheY-like chemotaxis protein
MPGTSPAANHHTAPPTILVVDDEGAVLDVVAAILEDEGYAVFRARDGLDALAIIDQEPIDLVLSDVKMPRLDGFGLARHLRARGNGISMVLMSAVHREAAIPGCHLMPKPFDAGDLLRAVAAILLADGKAGIPTTATGQSDGSDGQG